MSKKEFVVIILDPENLAQESFTKPLGEAIQDAMSLCKTVDPEDAHRLLREALERRAHVPLLLVHADAAHELAMIFFRRIRSEYPYLNSAFLLILHRSEAKVLGAIQSEHLLTQLVYPPWRELDIYQSLKDLLSRYLLQFAYEQLS
jgi:hypothetical protein